jgi:hypothetical protein
MVESITETAGIKLLSASRSAVLTSQWRILSIIRLNYFNPLVAAMVICRKDPGVKKAVQSRHELLALLQQNIYGLSTVQILLREQTQWSFAVPPQGILSSLLVS